MLHSLQYYACCYALLCLLHQQHRAASLTIIIDGATTNEWATRDEYKRLLEASNDLETALNQQQQQEQLDQLEYQQQQQPPPPPSAPPLPVPRRNLTERGSAPETLCGKRLIDMLDLVCGGRFFNAEIEPQIAEPSIKLKRASRLRSLSSSFQSSQPRVPSSLSSKQLSPSQQLSLSQQQQLPPIGQSDGEETNYPAEGSGAGIDRATEERNSRLQEIRMMQLEAQLLPSHLLIGHQQHSRQQTGTDNNNDGDTIIGTNTNNDNINPLTNKPRNRYNRMVLNRRIRGATEECCKRSCDMDTLKTYCAAPTKF